MFKKHYFDESYFEEINTLQKAYFLGWMFTDGNVKSDGNVSRLQLHERDGDILEMFVKELGGTIEMIKKHKGKEKYPVLEVNSKKFSSNLKKLGCVPRKTFIVKPPELDRKFQKPFWRACWEADGSFTISDRRKKRDGYRAAILYNGTEAMCKGFRDYMNWHGKIFLSNKKQKSKIKTKRVMKSLSFLKRSRKEYNKIYDGTNFYLKRKRELFDQYLAERQFYEQEEYYLVEGR